MQVVDAVQIHIFCVPCKSTFPHPKVEVRSVDSFYLDATLALRGVQDGVETTDVPFSHILGKEELAENSRFQSNRPYREKLC